MASNQSGMAVAPMKLNNLSNTTTYITGHDDSTSKSIIYASRPPAWQTFADKLGFNVLYTTSHFPVSLNDNRDINTHDALIASGRMGLVNQHGTVCRMVDFGPSDDEPLLHRTKSLDYGIVIEGEMEMILSSGETCLLKRGDVAVQRGTMHAWKNASRSEWARMIFVLQDCEAVVVGGKNLGEDLGAASAMIPPSKN